MLPRDPTDPFLRMSYADQLQVSLKFEGCFYELLSFESFLQAAEFQRQSMQEHYFR